MTDRPVYFPMLSVATAQLPLLWTLSITHFI